MFVGATKKNSSDNARLQAANIAQDKIEKIRQLPYSAIAANSADTSAGQTTPNLYDPTYADSQFGPFTALDTGHGIRKIYTDYNVTLYPAAASGLASQYKVVTVTGYWTGSPTPVKRVVLQTIIYRQYAGPPLDAFTTNPAIDDSGVIGGISLASVVLSAHVNTSAGAAPASVQFKIVGIRRPDARQPAREDERREHGQRLLVRPQHEHVLLDVGLFGRSQHGIRLPSNGLLYRRLRRQHHAPLPDHRSHASAGAAGGCNRYCRQRQGEPVVGPVHGDGPCRLRDLPCLERSGPWTTPIATLGFTATATQPPTTYTDASVANGTTYYYAVRAVTNEPRRSALVVSNEVTPNASGDSTPPTAPSPVTATAAPSAATITLTWGASTDPGSPSTGIKEYEIWRSADGVTWGTSPLTVWTNLTNLTYSDAAAGWATTWYYRMRAVDVALNPGAWSATVSATTIAQAFHDLRISVQNGNGNDCNVWVLSPSLDHYFNSSGTDVGTGPPAGVYIDKNGTVSFSICPTAHTRSTRRRGQRRRRHTAPRSRLPTAR